MSQQQYIPACECTNLGRKVAQKIKFCTGASNYLWIFSVELASSHTYGAYNFEMASRFLENPYTLYAQAESYTRL